MSDKKMAFGGWVLLIYFLGSMFGLAILASNVRDLKRDNSKLNKDLKTASELCPGIKDFL